MSETTCKCPKPNDVPTLRQTDQHTRLLIMEGAVAPSAELHILSNHGGEGATRCPRCGAQTAARHRRKTPCPNGHVLSALGNALYAWDEGERAEPNCPPDATPGERWKFQGFMLARKHDFGGLARFYLRRPQPPEDSPVL